MIPGSVRTVIAIVSPSRLKAIAVNLALWQRLKRNFKARGIWNDYFDSEQYLRLHPDVAEAGINPLVHFLVFGVEEGRSPSAEFNSNEYLRRSPDVARARVNPLLHYALFGIGEQRPASAGVQ